MEIIKDWAVEVITFVLVLFLGTAAVTPKANTCEESTHGTYHSSKETSAR